MSTLQDMPIGMILPQMAGGNQSLFYWIQVPLHMMKPISVSIIEQIINV